MADGTCGACGREHRVRCAPTARADASNATELRSSVAAHAVHHEPQADMQRIAIVVLVVVFSSAIAAAEERRNAVYAEVLGKGGLWGIGFDHRVSRRALLGVVGSTYLIEGQGYVTLSPYLGLYVARAAHSSWFVDAGAQLAHVWTESPVPEWSPESSTGVGALLSTGYEYRGQVLFRVYIHGVLGKGGALPWLGTSVGWTF